MERNRERVTRADVAKAAGVSETIVSYVVNNNRYVAKEKRQRVEDAIAALHYRPNNVARALKGKRSNQLLFIADQITNEYFSRIVSEMDKYAYEARYSAGECGDTGFRTLFRGENRGKPLNQQRKKEYYLHRSHQQAGECQRSVGSSSQRISG